MKYPDLFKKATGYEPFPYQERIAAGDRLPGFLAAPTGSGKTAAMILGWFWHRRHHPDPAVRRQTPRRLIYTLPMRVLVDQVHGETQTWFRKLHLDDPPMVQILRGGHVEREWDHHPERDAVLIGTQDQLLSRALNRGYSMSRFLWPVHFALLHNDAWWVFDEVQLMGPGVRTGAQLEGLRRSLGTFGPAGTTWMSATLRKEWLHTADLDPSGLDTVELDEVDRGRDALRQRIEASKGLQQAPEQELRRLANWIAETVHQPDSLTLVVVNRVKRAQELAAHLKHILDGSSELLLIHGRFRPADRHKIHDRLRAPLPKGGRMVVATQAVEAGVDLSAAALVTDLAPWPSLVQRFGRCNRFAELATGHIWWIDADTSRAESVLPYEPASLDSAREILRSLRDAAIRNLPSVREELPISDVPRRQDVIDLFDTDPDLDGNHLDISRFIRETGACNVALFWRQIPSGSEPDAALTGPTEEELCSVPIGAFRELVKALHKRTGGAWQWDPLDGCWSRVHQGGNAPAPGFISPGYTYLLTSQAGGYDAETGFDPRIKAAVPIVGTPTGNPPEAYQSDPWSKLKCFVRLSDHLADARTEAQRLLERLNGLVDNPDLSDAVVRAACWHDVGKAHQVFQNAVINSPHPGLMAKAPRFHRYERKGFRHELVSALAALESGLDDLVAYLVAAHHGKVRMALRPLAGFPLSVAGQLALRGVAEGDRIPAVSLGGNKASRPFSIQLDLARLGRGPAGEHSWSERAWRLVDSHGPFRLAFLELLVRVSDWRASASPSHTLPVTPEESLTSEVPHHD